MGLLVRQPEEPNGWRGSLGGGGQARDEPAAREGGDQLAPFHPMLLAAHCSVICPRLVTAARPLVTLFAETIPVTTIQVDRMTADPRANPSMANLGANRGPAPVNRPQPGEAFFQQSIADLSKRLDERDAKQSTSGPEAAAEARRRAMRAYELERGRKLRLLLTGAAAVVATACIAWFVVLLGEPEGAAAPGPIASAQPSPSASPASPVVIASAVPAPEAPQAAEAPPPPPPAPPPLVEAQPPSPPPPPPQQTAAAQPSEPPPVEPAQAARPLRRNAIRE